MQRGGTKLVDILYDLAYTGSRTVTVTVAASTNGGNTYTLPCSLFSGAGYGAGVAPGNDRQITWDAGADWGEHFSASLRVRVTAQTVDETWARAYGGCNCLCSAFSVACTASGVYVTTGSLVGPSGLSVKKLNIDGSFAWADAFGLVGSAPSVAATPDGGCVVAGWTQGNPDNNGGGGWVAKVSLDGSIAWQHIFQGLGGFASVSPTPDGGYFLAGGTYPGLCESFRAWIVKLNGDGSIAWQKLYGENGSSGRSAVATDDGGCIVVGHSWDSNCFLADPWVLKLRSDGSVAWHHTYRPAYGNKYASLTTVAETSDGGYVAAGVSPDNSSGWMLKLDRGGSVVWQKTYGGTGTNAFASVHPTANGGCVVAGSTSSLGSLHPSAWLLKLNGDGSPVWQRSYAGMEGSGGASVASTADGGYALVGRWNFPASGSAAWVIKLNGDGLTEFDPSSGGATADTACAITETSVTVTTPTISVSNALIASVDSVAPITYTTSGPPETQQAPSPAISPLFTLDTRSAQTDTLPLGLTGWWTFDSSEVVWSSPSSGVALNRSGGDHRFILEGFPKATATAPGTVGQALAFNPNYLSTTNSLSRFMPNSTGTISAWFYALPGNVGSGAYGDMSAFVTDGTVLGGYVWLGYDGANVWAGGYDGGLRSLSSPAPQRQWTHAVWVHQNNTLSLWQDGLLVGERSLGNIQDTTHRVAIGRSFVGNSFTGYLDDVRIYNRALSPNEIDRLHDGQDDGTLTQGLTGWWTMDAGDVLWTSAYSATALDRSGNDRNAALNGFSEFTASVGGKFGEALSFKGETAYSDCTLGDLMTRSEGSLSLWFYAKTNSDSWGSAYYDTFLTGGAAVALSVGKKGLQAASSEVDVCGYYGAASREIAVPLSSEQWVYVAWVHVGGMLYLYTNGVHAASAALGDITGLDQPIWLGRSWLFIGYLDDLRTYNRALSPSEVQELYELGSSPKPPEITTQPQSRSFTLGNNAVFSVGATGTLPLNYQWRFDGVDMSGATGGTLSLTNIQPAMAGDYSVVVSNPYGSVTSSTAQLILLSQTDRKPTNTEVGGGTIPADNHLEVFKDGAFHADEPVFSNRMTIVLTHGWKSDPDAWAKNMAARLVANLSGVAFNVVVWDWHQEALSVVASARTPGQGRALGEALLQVLGRDYSMPIHFIGHSLGTLVNAAAADYLHGDSPGAAPTKSASAFLPSSTHMTLLDEAELAPESLNLAVSFLTSQITGVPLPVRPFYEHPLPKRCAWADNYIAAVGLFHDQAANVILTNGFATDAPDWMAYWRAAAAFHSYPWIWYDLTITDHNTGLMGNQWSFEKNGFSAAPLPNSAFVQAISSSELDLTPTDVVWAYRLLIQRLATELFWATGYTIVGLVKDYVVPVAGDVLIRVEDELTRDPYALVLPEGAFAPDLVLSLSTSGAGGPLALNGEDDKYRGPRDGGVNTPASAWMKVAVPSNSVSMSFDFMIQGDGGDDRFAAAVSGTNVLSLETTLIRTNVTMNSGLLDVSQWAGQTVELFFGIVGGTSTNAEVTVRGIRFYNLVAPTLQAKAYGEDLVIISWPLVANGYALESTADVAAADSWSAITNAPAIVDLQNTITNRISAGSRFYRLHRTP